MGGMVVARKGVARCMGLRGAIEQSRRAVREKDYVVSEWCKNHARDSEVWRNKLIMLRVGWRAREVGRDYRW
jgi:hypothetical protein